MFVNMLKYILLNLLFLENCLGNKYSITPSPPHLPKNGHLFLQNIEL